MKFYNLFHFISFFPSYFFLLELPWVNESSVYTNMTRGTGPIHTPKLLFIPQLSDTYIQTQYTSAYDDSMSEHALASFELDRRTNHNGNTGVNNNDDSRSFETLRRNNFSSSRFGDTITTTTTPNSFKLPPPGKYYPCFQK